MLRGLTPTGGVITSAGVVLAATFTLLTIFPLVFAVEFGLLVAGGVLLDAIVVRALLVPALALDAGRCIRWPSRLAQANPRGLPESPAERYAVQTGRGVSP